MVDNKSRCREQDGVYLTTRRLHNCTCAMSCSHQQSVLLYENMKSTEKAVRTHVLKLRASNIRRNIEQTDKLFYTNDRRRFKSNGSSVHDAIKICSIEWCDRRPRSGSGRICNVLLLA